MTERAAVTGRGGGRKADFNRTYTRPDPREYFHTPTPLDYQIPQRDHPVIDEAQHRAMFLAVLREHFLPAIASGAFTGTPNWPRRLRIHRLTDSGISRTGTSAPRTDA